MGLGGVLCGAPLLSSLRPSTWTATPLAVIYVCRGCDFPIYVYQRVGQDSFGIPTPGELRSRAGPRCPSCGRELGAPSVDDVVVLRRGEARKMLKRPSPRLQPFPP